MTHPTHYNLLLPREIAELGIASQDRLAHVLGASLIDHIDELDDLTDAHNDALAQVRAYKHQIVPALEMQIAQLTATLNEKA